MADNFLEYHYKDYEEKKDAWLRKKRHLPKLRLRNIQKPDDEAL